MITETIALSAGASDGFSVGDWVIQCAPIFVSIVTGFTGWINYRSNKAAQSDPMKIAMATKLTAEANSMEAVLAKFNEAITLTQSRG